MAVKINLISNDERGPVFEALDLETNEPVNTKNWFEKSKDKWHIVLEPNSANRKYISHNEFFTKSVDDEYLVEDKTSAPRVLGTSKPDQKLIPYMSDEDREMYEAILARATENKKSQVAAPLTEEEKLLRQIAKLQEKLNAKLQGGN